MYFCILNMIEKHVWYSDYRSIRWNDISRLGDEFILYADLSNSLK